MKKTMLIAAVVALAGMQIQTARAGDREWATAGKILAGVAIGAAIVSAVDAHASYTVTYSPAPAYCPPPAPVVYAPPRAVCAPAPVVVYRPPVVCTPAPVVVYRAPVVCAPPVVVHRPAMVYAPPVRVVHHGHHGRGRHGRW